MSCGREGREVGTVREIVAIWYRGANYQIGRGRDFYRDPARGESSPQPLECWPLTREGWSGAWSRFTVVEAPGTIALAGPPRPAVGTAHRSGRPARHATPHAASCAIWPSHVRALRFRPRPPPGRPPPGRSPPPVPLRPVRACHVDAVYAACRYPARVAHLHAVSPGRHRAGGPAPRGTHHAARVGLGRRARDLARRCEPPRGRRGDAAGRRRRLRDHRAVSRIFRRIEPGPARGSPCLM